MSKLLRGKKTSLKNFTENFTKVPNIILHASGITPVEKLILIELQSYASRPDWILAYTRMANDLHLNKPHFIDCWKSLIARGYITVVNNSYSINYNLLNGTHSVPANIGIATTPRNTPKEIDHTNDGMPTIPTVGMATTPSKVCLQYQNGMATTPIEEEIKEEDKESKSNKNKQVEIPLKTEIGTPTNKSEFNLLEYSNTLSIQEVIDFNQKSFNKKIEYLDQFSNDYDHQCKFIFIMRNREKLEIQQTLIRVEQQEESNVQPHMEEDHRNKADQLYNWHL